MNNFKIWNQWRKYNKNSNLHKLMVLFDIVHSPTFEMYYKIYKD